jgi:uncharacterized protein YyaL (SSP411 family)
MPRPRETDVSEKEPNRLVTEKSPYLLQHAYNPVEWYPWSEEAFEKALREDKPVFLSIGYSTCHWCHVMEKESFEDPDVARLMNETFISVKVDREERPDIDAVYMTVCQMMTGSGGWPLTVILTPDKKPFLAGTYFPKEGRFGRIGLLDLIPRIKSMWKEEQGEILRLSREITDLLQREEPTLPAGVPDESFLHATFEQLRALFDEENGGFGAAPKFPAPHQLLFLLRYWKRTGNEAALRSVTVTLDAMSRGGIHDHIGGGFHRYATDSAWLIPHFEKMLYDQAMLAMSYTEAYQATGKEHYRETAGKIITYVLREMTDPGGGFYSAEDADSEGEEGKFYLWTHDEIVEALGPEDAALICAVFTITKDGNFIDPAHGEKTGKNILHQKRSFRQLSEELALPERELRHRVSACLDTLYSVRNRRIHPHKDDKILTDWNGLMIAAMATAARVFQNREYLGAAAKAADFIFRHLYDGGGRLLHRYREEEASLPAHADDYAFFVTGLVELYQATFEARYLAAALSLNKTLLDHFWDRDKGGIFFTADDGETLLVRKKEIYDGAVPSGNSVALLNLLRLSRMTGDVALEDKASQCAKTFYHAVLEAPSAHTFFAAAIDFALGPSYEVVIAGDPQAEDTREMTRALNSVYIPNKVMLLRPSDQGECQIADLAEFTRNQTGIGRKATVYVCRNRQCLQPVTDAEAMLRMLQE